MRTFRFEEPMPARYTERLWPVYAAGASTIAAMFGLWPFFPGWNLLPFLPYLAFMAVTFLRSRRRHRAWMRAADDWQRRMLDFYAQPWEQRDKAMWS